MNNILLGKTLKAMYKQSGKTITQLSDESGLSIDTINNLFYARVQKPGLSDVDTLTRTMGYSLRQLMEFMALKLPHDADITAEFVKYTLAENDVLHNQHNFGNSSDCLPNDNAERQIKALAAEHEKQLDRFRATHLMYVQQIQNQYKAQLADMEKLLHNDKALNIARMTNRVLGAALFAETAGLILLAFYHI